MKDNNTLMDINWKEMAKEYKESYEDDEGVHEYVEGLLPIYYGEINSTYHDYIGSPLNIEVTNAHVGMTFDQIMNAELFDEFLCRFLGEYMKIEEEE
jgi:hypothetical protein